jgi:uncharacterized protein (TIGR02996 family)
MNDSRERELLAAIWCAPTDRAALAVYADWLSDHGGDATRGEFIQLSLLDRRTPAQDKRRTALLAKHRGAWLGAARPFVWTWTESDETPGFIDQVKIGLTKLARGFDHVIALGPRLRVDPNPIVTAADRATFAALPLDRLYGLGMYENDITWVTERLIHAIAPKLGGLRRLAISGSYLPLNGWRDLLTAVGMLEDVYLYVYSEPDDYIDALLDSPVARTLRRARLNQPRTARMRARLSSAPFEVELVRT